MKIERDESFAANLHLNFDVPFFEEIGLPPRFNPKQIGILLYVHCLPSLVDLMLSLKRVGMLCQNIFLIPKMYSTVPSAENAVRSLEITMFSEEFSFRPGLYDEANHSFLERQVERIGKILSHRSSIKRLIIVDDGGLLTAVWWKHSITSSFYFDVVSIQQTSSGLSHRRLDRSPILKIDVGRSVAKKFFESQAIIVGVLEKTSTLKLLEGRKKIGVVGLGALGTRLAIMLRNMGKDVSGYDRANIPSIPGVHLSKGWRDCLKKSDVIFGCTGTNWLDIEQIVSPFSNEVEFLSCSSRDVEFKTLLQYNDSREDGDLRAFSRISKSLPRGLICNIQNWGFPINFDREKEWERPSEIAITRALIFVAIMQGIASSTNFVEEKIDSILPKLQKAVVKNWLEFYSKSPSDYGVDKLLFDDIDWWSRATHQ